MVSKKENKKDGLLRSLVSSIVIGSSLLNASLATLSRKPGLEQKLEKPPVFQLLPETYAYAQVSEPINDWVSSIYMNQNKDELRKEVNTEVYKRLGRYLTLPPAKESLQNRLLYSFISMRYVKPAPLPIYGEFEGIPMFMGEYSGHYSHVEKFYTDELRKIIPIYPSPGIRFVGEKKDDIDFGSEVRANDLQFLFHLYLKLKDAGKNDHELVNFLEKVIFTNPVYHNVSANLIKANILKEGILNLEVIHWFNRFSYQDKISDLGRNRIEGLAQNVNLLKKLFKFPSGYITPPEFVTNPNHYFIIPEFLYQTLNINNLREAMKLTNGAFITKSQVEEVKKLWGYDDNQINQFYTRLLNTNAELASTLDRILVEEFSRYGQETIKAIKDTIAIVNLEMDKFFSVGYRSLLNSNSPFFKDKIFENPENLRSYYKQIIITFNDIFSESGWSNTVLKSLNMTTYEALKKGKIGLWINAEQNYSQFASWINNLFSQNILNFQRDGFSGREFTRNWKVLYDKYIRGSVESQDTYGWLDWLY
ncbi:MAG: hypothetical protein QW524_03855 [Candidatus Woesearchaeota archaeon]